MHDDIYIGLDVGSTTVKIAALDANGTMLFARYRRHLSEVRATAAEMLREADSVLVGRHRYFALTGSGAISLSTEIGMPFVQEVAASGLYIRRSIPDADVAIELGGEDAKLTFFTGGVEQRMNETCAGGTGAFIDQMAAFLDTDAAGLDKLAGGFKTLYPIASRCGVFARTDILPLLNEGCSRADIAASIMQAIVNQTISGLARGRSIKGKVVFLGGPLAFLPSLRERFVLTLKLNGENAVFPRYAEYFVAMGAALYARRAAEQRASLRIGASEPGAVGTIVYGAVGSGGLLDGRAIPAPAETAKKSRGKTPCAPHGPEDGQNGEDALRFILHKLEHAENTKESRHLEPLFADEAALAEFRARHAGAKLPRASLEDCAGDAWLGMDSGSTTIKAVLLDDQKRLLYSFYGPNQGEPLQSAAAVLRDIYARSGRGMKIRACAVTGYGSGLLAAGLRADIDEVETVAHFTGARFFRPEVSYILDIGGQDIKCMRVRSGSIDRIQLNEACSAGCGSFVETFARSLGMPLDRFVEEALRARKPVDLGTRCTVFMNSKVKQAQKDGAEVGDIAAGLSCSVVRNACYKVMKITNMDELGEHVVAQGGAFANDALLRALELQLRRPVVRPDIAGLMGAFGAALIAAERGPQNGASKLIGPEEAENFQVRTRSARCGHCANHCLLTVCAFDDGRRYVSGNRCERGAGEMPQDLPNLYDFKYKRLFSHYTPLPKEEARRGVVGIPRALNIFENYPLWFTIFTRLGFRVELSSPSSKELFFKGYGTIPSQTVCYPAKLAHGHILDLIERKVGWIFFPCLPFEQKNFSTQAASFNCPVVIGYPELLAKNISALKDAHIPFFHHFLPLDKNVLGKRLRHIPLFADVPLFELEAAVRAGFAEMEAYKDDIRKAGERL
jgi:predicted CoA-substrate-specific enzyme activase